MHKKLLSPLTAQNAPNVVFCPDLLGELKCSPNLLAVARRKGENKGKEG